MPKTLAFTMPVGVDEEGLRDGADAVGLSDGVVLTTRAASSARLVLGEAPGVRRNVAESHADDLEAVVAVLVVRIGQQRELLRHGWHHDAQKLSTTGLPRSSDNATVPSPFSAGSTKSGAGSPTSTEPGSATSIDSAFARRRRRGLTAGAGEHHDRDPGHERDDNDRDRDEKAASPSGCRFRRRGRGCRRQRRRTAQRGRGSRTEEPDRTRGVGRRCSCHAPPMKNAPSSVAATT